MGEATPHKSNPVRVDAGNALSRADTRFAGAPIRRFAHSPPGSSLITDLVLTDYFPQKVQRCLSHHLFECRSIGREEQLFHL
jgi:hypothetical protein